MPYTVTPFVNKGRKNKPAHSLRVVVPQPILFDIDCAILEGGQSLFALNLAKEQAGQVVPYYQDYGYDFGLELFTGTDQDFKKLLREFQPRPLKRYGNSSFGFSVGSSRNSLALQVLGLSHGVKLVCDIVTLKEPTPGYSDRAILYKVNR